MSSEKLGRARGVGGDTTVIRAGPFTSSGPTVAYAFDSWQKSGEASLAQLDRAESYAFAKAAASRRAPRWAERGASARCDLKMWCGAPIGKLACRGGGLAGVEVC